VTPTEAALIIAACGTVLSPIVAGLSALISLSNSRKLDTTNAKFEATKTDLHRLEINTNSIKDALIASTKLASHAEGVAEGIAKEKANPS
jgi:hypothetical protein